VFAGEIEHLALGLDDAGATHLLALAQDADDVVLVLPDGRGRRFALSYGLKNLLGAVWLQMAWLLAAGDGVKRCELLDCFRVIAFEPGEQPPLDAPRGTRGKYKTRKDIRFCKNRGCKQKYHYRRTAGWPGYV
jgi:hypothetical protein